ncbi:hypothetical protein ACFL2D_01680, partial [Patescibacteria group bacterium]
IPLFFEDTIDVSASRLTRYIDYCRDQQWNPQVRQENIVRFERKNLTKQLAELFEEVRNGVA